MSPAAASDPMAVPDGVPEDAVDELFGLPVDEFTPRRDALAKEVRSAGRRCAAAWVKGLRKPSAAAWVVNQLARTRPREAKELLRAGAALREAHERVLGGDGDPAQLRAAAEAEHAAARALLADAAGFLDRDGHAPSRATLERVADTVRAVALDDEARAGFEAGRLIRERRASGFGPLAGGAAKAGSTRSGSGRAPKPGSTGSGSGRAKAKAPAAPARSRAAKPKATARPGAASREREVRAAARKALKEATAEERAAAREVRAAERELAAAQREAERAQSRLEAAAAALEEARSRETDAASRAEAARAELDA